MKLRDFIKPKTGDKDEDIIISTFEKNLELYKNKSMSWIVRITADETRIRIDELQQLLEQYYNKEEK